MSLSSRFGRVAVRARGRNREIFRVFEADGRRASWFIWPRIRKLRRLELVDRGRTLLAIGGRVRRRPIDVRLFRLRDGVQLAAFDNVRGGEPWDEFVVLRSDYEAVFILGAAGALMAVDLTDGGRALVHKFEPNEVVAIAPSTAQAAFAAVRYPTPPTLTSTGVQKPSDNTTRLLRVCPGCTPKVIVTTQSRGAQLYPARDGGLLAVFAEGTQAKLVSIDSQGEILATERLAFQPRQAVPNADDSAFFVAGVLSPLITFDRRSGRQRVLVPSTQPIAADRPIRVGRHGRSLLLPSSAKQIRVLPLDEDCALFAAAAANRGVYSSDGSLVALIERPAGKQTLHVIDVANCATKFVWPFTASQPSAESLVFGDNGHVWAIQGDRIAIFTMNDDLDELTPKDRALMPATP